MRRTVDCIYIHVRSFGDYHHIACTARRERSNVCLSLGSVRIGLAAVRLGLEAIRLGFGRLGRLFGGGRLRLHF